jgi:flagellar hook-length control protein FliK
VAAIAAESVTSAHGAIGATAGVPADISDIFAEILDDITQDLSSSDPATSSVAAANDAAPPTSADTTPAARPGTLLQSALADLQARLAPATADGSDGGDRKADKADDAKSGTQESNQDNPGLAQILAAQQALPSPPIGTPNQSANTAPLSCDPPAQDDAWSDLASDPIPLRGNEDMPPAKPARTPSNVDPALFAGTQAVAPPPDPVTQPAAPTGDPSGNESTAPQPPVMPSTAALATDVETTDTAAAPMVSTGSVQKPAKPAPAAADTTKTELQGSTAAALAAVSTAATRAFSDQLTSSAAALPLHRGSDDSKTDASNAPAQPSSNSATADAAAPTAPPTAPAATPAALPAQPHAAPQPDMANVAAVATPSTAASAPHAAAPIAAQLQVLQSDPQDTTPNLAALAVTIAAKSADGAKHFDIRLDPPELGRVDIRLTVDDAGRAQAALAVEKPQTLELLQKDSPQLERALKDAGLDLSQNGLNFSLKGQQQQQGSNAPAGRHRHHTVRAIVAADAASTLSTAAVPSSDARLDIRV